ncbi:RNA pseudouridine synthase 4, mitochondrial [Heracleum sosnowskyi]|uniref:RNA pseudouridine synthase 4, mitochondrial n=1 Tax=Heracleum sosnowskyi TaxID=360622 RepID=A0AAD8J2G1_9APIA|nr:RNA pseudouridine synthase 4, mitochondrial [Heracleum sosnowskyi]
MWGQSHLRRLFLRPSLSPTTSISPTPYIHSLRTHCTKSQGKWLTLPPFTHTINGSSLGKEIYSKESPEDKGETTAFKWIIKCCPQLPKSLVQKLFRLRQVRRECVDVSSLDISGLAQERRVKRVGAKDAMQYGDRIFLPNSVQELHSEKTERTEKIECRYNEEEQKFLHSLELYKDSAIIVVNKPHGMPVQGGAGIKRSLDELASTYLKHDSSESPRLVHRLDRDSSGILVMGRTQLSTTILHSIFREKTSGASTEDLEEKKEILQRKYWALVFGSPRRRQGNISLPLGKVVMDDGKSERITVVDNADNMPSQHAITEYRVIGSSSHGYTWLELCPRTGRKHQLRVHCAEVLGTPIVGDYKYGWQAHRKYFPFSDLEENLDEKLLKGKKLPFGLDLEHGSVSDKRPKLHLHCKEMTLPNVSLAIDRAQRCSPRNLANLESLKLDAPLPYHMQRSWDILNS